MSAVRTQVRTLFCALTLSVLAAPAGAATLSRVLVVDCASLSDPQICGDTPSCVAHLAVSHSRHGAHVTAVAVSTTAIHTTRAHHHRARVHTHGVPGLTATHSSSHPASLPRPARSAPAHRAPAPATPRYDGGKTAHNRYRSIAGAVAFAPPAAPGRDDSAMRLATRSETFVPDPSTRLDLSRGPPRGQPTSTSAASSSTRRAAPHRTVSTPVPSAPSAARTIASAIHLELTAARTTTPPFVPCARAFALASALRPDLAGLPGLAGPADRAPLAPLFVSRALARPGVRRREGTAPHLLWPSNSGGLT